MKPPFERVEVYDGPELVGARWWQESMFLSDPVARRAAVVALAALSGTVALVGAAGSLARGCEDPSVTFQRRPSIDVQRELGWSFGSEADPLTFDGATEAGALYAVMDALPQTLAPEDLALRPYYVPTLFQSVTASPAAGPIAPLGKRLRDVVRPIMTDAMGSAYERGRAFAAAMEEDTRGRAVVVDLPGPEAVAFAAALATRFDPVFGFDNWPHPRGVVPSHLTLAAALHFAAELDRRAAARPAGAPPAFIFDAHRLDPYTDAADRFDNRYVARLPSAENLRALGVREVLCVRPGGTDREADDMNADFVAYDAAGIPVTLWVAGAAVMGYRPVSRATLFGGPASEHVRPEGFGTVGVARAAESGEVVGRSFGFGGGSGSWGRSGSWTRIGGTGGA